MHADNSFAADYVVVGSGSAGAVMAARLSENADVRVILLEAGGEDNTHLIRMPAAVGMLLDSGRHNWNYSTTPQENLANRPILMREARCLAGRRRSMEWSISAAMRWTMSVGRAKALMGGDMRMCCPISANLKTMQAVATRITVKMVLFVS